MSRRSGIVMALVFAFSVVGLDWSLGVAPDPYRSPDPMAYGSNLVHLVRYVHLLRALNNDPSPS